MMNGLLSHSGCHMLSDIEYKKLAWHSRRGMRELDLLLLPFVEKCLPQLSEDERAQYRRLLMEEDQDLYNWLVMREPVPHPELVAIIERVRGAG